MEGRSKYILVLTPTRRGGKDEAVILIRLMFIEFEVMKAEDAMVVGEHARGSVP